MTKTNAQPVIYGAGEVLSARHFPTWLGLALAAGAVNAGAFLANQRFVTHVTGTVTRIGLDVGQWVLMGEYALVLGLFVLGAFFSVFAVQARALRGRKPMPWAPLAATTGLLLLVALFGHAGLFGQLGTTVEQPGDFALLSVLALAMGLMNATVASTTALAVRTTHMTGPASDLGVSLGLAAVSTGVARLEALKLAALRGGKIVCFIFGAMAMVEFVAALGFLAFAVPAVVIGLATARTFVERAPAASPVVVVPPTPARSLES